MWSGENGQHKALFLLLRLYRLILTGAVWPRGKRLEQENTIKFAIEHRLARTGLGEEIYCGPKA